MDATLARYHAERLAVLSEDRRRSTLLVLSEMRAATGSGDLADTDAVDFQRVLSARAAKGDAPGTLRKRQAIIRAFFEWAYRERVIDAETLLALRAVRPPVAISRLAAPQPYKASELRSLRAMLDECWPKLDPEDTSRWLGRFRDGRSPYSRVRSHVIRCQLDAIIAQALYLGLRRREIFALDIVTAHCDNDELIVWRDESRCIERARGVPNTRAARAAMSDWLDCRWALMPDHHALWLNTHARTTAHQPMTRATFDKLLATYVGPGWTLKHLRDTCAAGWVRAGLPAEHLRQLLGLSRIEDTLPYMRLVAGSLVGRMGELSEHFEKLIGPVVSGDLAA